VGYATTFRLFMQMMDIECKIEHNTECYHSWDLVRLDGDWYITDIYSDAGTGNYAHFNMTDEMWSQEQNWDHDYFPAATSLKYNMAFQKRKTVKSIYDIPSALREAMDEQLGSVMIAFEQEITDEDAQIATYTASTLDEQLMSNTYENMPYTLVSYKWVQNPDDNSYLFHVSFGSYNTTETDSGLTEKQMEKIQKKIQKALDGLTPSTGSVTYNEETGEMIGTTDADALSVDDYSTTEESTEAEAAVGTPVG
jgi:hypothetical protein